MIFLNRINTYLTCLRNCGTIVCVMVALLAISTSVKAQGDATVNARIDRAQISVGDQARVFLEARVNPSSCVLQWAAIPDSCNDLEITKEKIDTIKQGGFVTYRQRLLVTGFDSGSFEVPAFVFAVTPNSGAAYTLQTDSLKLLVQTVAVDTTKGFKGIKGIIYIKTSWLDYIWYIVGGAVLLLIIAGIILFFALRKKPAKTVPPVPKEPLQTIALRKLSALDKQQLWQQNKAKEYYVELTDIVRNYVEERFATPVMELTTDELLHKAARDPELQPYAPLLSAILHTADLAKFAKAQPLPQEHMEAMVKARQLVESSRPVIVSEPTTDQKI